MLNAMRRGSKSFLAKILIGLLVMSFAVWGVSGFVNTVDPTEVARAGSTPVATTDFARVYESYRNNIAQQMGTVLTPQQAAAIGLPGQVLSTLVTEALQVDAARAIGIDVSDETIAERVRTNPNFAGPDGSFNRAAFDRILNLNRISEQEFIATERRAAMQEMLVNGIVGGITAPAAYLQAFNRYANQTRTVSFLPFTEDALGAITDPTEAELAAYYEEQKERFRSPERRAVSLITLSAEILADPGAVTDDAIRRAYDVPGAYGAPERRRVQQVRVPSSEIAAQAVAALENGAAFEAILVELGRSFSDADLGIVTEDALVNAAVAEAAFGMAEPGVVAVETRFGPTLVRVSAILPAEKRPFEEVEAEIRETLAADEAGQQVNEVFIDVEDAVAGGARADEVAERFGLPLRTIPSVTRSGLGPDGTEVDVDDAVLAEAFADAPGDDPARVNVGEDVVWVQVDSVEEAADQPLDAVMADVLADWTRAEKAERLAALAEEAAEAVQTGTTITNLAARYGLAAQTTEPFSRNTPPAGLPDVVARAAFEGPLGFTTSVLDERGTPIVISVAEVSEPTFFEGQADLQPIGRTLNEGLANALVSGIVSGWQAEVGATVNQPVIDQVIGTAQGRS